MNKVLIITTSIFGLMAAQGFSARADEALDKLAKDPKQWVMQQGDDANTRYSAAWHGAVDQGKLPTKEKTVDTAGLGAVGGYAGLASYTSLGGTLTVFSLCQANRSRRSRER